MYLRYKNTVEPVTSNIILANGPSKLLVVKENLFASLRKSTDKRSTINQLIIYQLQSPLAVVN